MKDHECMVGEFVKCKKYPLVGYVGFIRSVNRWGHSGLVKDYLVEDSYKTLIGFNPWINLDDWELCQPRGLTSKPMTGFTLTNNKGICANCGESYGEHCAIDDWCPVDGAPSLYSTIYKYLSINAANPDDEFPVDFPSSKPMSKECPCGIHRADCIYHA